jgi:hypothetical protein
MKMLVLFHVKQTAAEPRVNPPSLRAQREQHDSQPSHAHRLLAGWKPHKDIDPASKYDRICCRAVNGLSKVHKLPKMSRPTKFGFIVRVQRAWIQNEPECNHGNQGQTRDLILYSFGVANRAAIRNVTVSPCNVAPRRRTSGVKEKCCPRMTQSRSESSVRSASIIPSREPPMWTVAAREHSEAVHGMGQLTA